MRNRPADTQIIFKLLKINVSWIYCSIELLFTFFPSEFFNASELTEFSTVISYIDKDHENKNTTRYYMDRWSLIKSLST